MDITRRIWRFFLFSPIKTTLLNRSAARYPSGIVSACLNHLQATHLLNLILNTTCFDAQSCAFFNDKEFLK